MRSGPRVALIVQGSQVKFTAIRYPTRMIILADVWEGYVWEKYYYNEPWPYNATNTGRIPIVRYGCPIGMGINTVVSFAMDTSNPL